MERNLLPRIFLALGAFIIVLSCSILPYQDVEIFVTVAAGKDDITSQVTVVDRKWIIEIHSQSGIGSAEIQYGSGKQELVLRLYLSGLENLRIEGNGVSVEASVSSSPPHAVRQSAATGTSERAELTPADALWLDIRPVSNDPGTQPTIPMKDGYFEVPLAPELIAAGKDFGQGLALDVSWIDFYR